MAKNISIQIFPAEHEVKEDLGLGVVKTRYIVPINDAIASAKSSSTKVFELMMDAQSTLSYYEYSHLKRDINVDKSTIRKIEKIFENSVVMNNISTLPISWGTLHEISLIDEDALKEAIKSGKIHVEATRAEVKKVRAELAATATPDAKVEEESASPEAVADEVAATPDANAEEESVSPEAVATAATPVEVAKFATDLGFVGASSQTPDANAEEESVSPEAVDDEVAATPAVYWPEPAFIMTNEGAKTLVEVDDEPTALPAVRINLELKKDVSLTPDEVRKEVEYFAAELSKTFFEVEILYNDAAELPKAA